MLLNIYHKAFNFKKNYLVLGAVIFLFGCQPLIVLHSTSEKIETNNVEVLSNDISSLITPYKTELDELMEVEVATLTEDLILEQPESTLGNHIAEIVFWQAEKSLEIPIDFSITNYGGLRVPYVNSGPLKVKDAYQIMPFDNYVVVMKVSGSVVLELANKMANYGGWPICNMSYLIKGGQAHNIKIQGEPFEISKEYTFALTDYLANGGDLLSFLKVIDYENTNIYLRDAIMNFWKDKTSNSEIIEVVKDGRVNVMD